MAPEQQPSLSEQLKALRAQSLNQYVAITQLIDLVENQAKEIERLSVSIKEAEYERLSVPIKEAEYDTKRNR